MAEVLGVVSSIATLVAIAQTSIKTILSFQNAPSEILALSNEACDLSIVASDIEALLKHDKRARPATDNLERMVLAIQEQIYELKGFVNNISRQNVKNGQLDRIRWVFEKKKAKVLQDGLRRAKQDLLAVLMSANASSSFRVQFTMDEMLLINERESRKRRFMSEEVAVQTVALARLQEEQTKATEVLRTILANLPPTAYSASDLAGTPPETAKAAALGHMRHQYLRGLSRRLSCSQGCMCSCHNIKILESPHFARSMTGTFLASYSALPNRHTRCSTTTCARHMPDIKVTYYFPSWLLHRVVHMIYSSSFGGPSFGLTVRKTVPVNSNLFSLTASGHIQRVRALFDANTSTPNDIHGISGETPLHFAIKYGRLEMCKALLDAGADMYLEDRRQRAAVDVAWAEVVASSKDPITLEGFRTLFGDKDHFELRRPQRLHQAILGISARDPYTVLQDSSEEEINAVDEEGKTALAWAVLKGDAVFVQALLNRGADPDICDNNKDSPLALCTHSASPKAMLLLLNSGASFTKNLRRYNPLHKAAFRQNSAVFLWPFLNHQEHIEIDARADGGETPLALATLRDHHLAVEFLLKLGADIESVDITGVTSLFWAIKYHSHKVLRVLLQKGADISFRSNNDTTVLHHLAEWGNCETVAIFRTLGLNIADFDIRDHQGLTATDIARRRKSPPEGFLVQFMSLMAAIKEYVSVEIGSEKSYDSAYDAYVDCVEEALV